MLAFSSHVQHLQHGGSREREVNSINNRGAACAARPALQPTAATQSCVYKISRCGAVKP
jgi:hypothetical protein